MAKFTKDQVNDAWGFYGEMRGGPFQQDERSALDLFNYAVDVFGGDPENARQFLNAQTGRYYADALTFLFPRRDEPLTAPEIRQAIENSRDHRQTNSFFKRYARFRPYEDAAKRVVNQLLEDEEVETALLDLGFKPLADRQGFQGAGDLTLSMEYEGNGFAVTFIYDTESQRFEAVNIDAESLGSATLDPEGVVQFVNSFLTQPSERRLKFQFARPSVRQRQLA
jgi:hypothetical protein